MSRLQGCKRPDPSQETPWTLSLPRVIAMLLMVTVAGMAIHSDRHDPVVHPTTIRLSAPVYGGPSIDDLADLETARQDDAAQAVQRAQDAVRDSERELVAQRALLTVQAPVASTASNEWFYRIAVCETGHDPPTDEWRTGYFGLEAGFPVGGLGWDYELAWAKRILAASGPGAWGCSGRVGYP